MYQSPRGTQDILPEEAAAWRYVEGRAAEQARRFGYGEIRTPTFEEAGLFLRGVGAGTEILLQNLGPDEPFGGGEPGVDFDPADPDTTGQVMLFRVRRTVMADHLDLLKG